MESESEATSQIIKIKSLGKVITGAGVEDYSRDSGKFEEINELQNSRKSECFDEENDIKNLPVEEEKPSNVLNMRKDPTDHQRMPAETPRENSVDSEVCLQIKNHSTANDRDENVDDAVNSEENAEMLQSTDKSLLKVDEISAAEDLVAENFYTELTSGRSPEDEKMHQSENMEGKWQGGEVEAIGVNGRDELVQVEESAIKKSVQHTALDIENVGEGSFVISTPQSESLSILGQDFDAKITGGDLKGSHESTGAYFEIVTVPGSLSFSDLRNGVDFETKSTEEFCKNSVASIGQMSTLRNNEDFEAENAGDAKLLDSNTDDIVEFVVSTMDGDVSNLDQDFGEEVHVRARKDTSIASEETPKSRAIEQNAHLTQEQGEDTNGVRASDHWEGVLLQTDSTIESLPFAIEVGKGQSSTACEEQEPTFSCQELPRVRLTAQVGLMPEAVYEHPIEQHDFSCGEQSMADSAVEGGKDQRSITEEKEGITFPVQEISEVGLTDEPIEDHLVESWEVSMGDQPINEQPANVEIPERCLTDEVFEDHLFEKQKFCRGEQSICEQASYVDIAKDQLPDLPQPSLRETVEMEYSENVQPSMEPMILHMEEMEKSQRIATKETCIESCENLVESIELPFQLDEIKGSPKNGNEDEAYRELRKGIENDKYRERDGYKEAVESLSFVKEMATSITGDQSGNRELKDSDKLSKSMSLEGSVWQGIEPDANREKIDYKEAATPPSVIKEIVAVVQDNQSENRVVKDSSNLSECRSLERNTLGDGQTRADTEGDESSLITRAVSVQPVTNSEHQTTEENFRVQPPIERIQLQDKEDASSNLINCLKPLEPLPKQLITAVTEIDSTPIVIQTHVASLKHRSRASQDLQIVEEVIDQGDKLSVTPNKEDDKAHRNTTERPTFLRFLGWLFCLLFCCRD